jgi:hypothetical protein
MLANGEQPPRSPRQPFNPVFIAIAVPVMLVGAWFGGFFGKVEPGRSFLAALGTCLALFVLSRVISPTR